MQCDVNSSRQNSCEYSTTRAILAHYFFANRFFTIFLRRSFAPNRKEQMKNCDVLKKVPACREYLAKIFKDLTLHKRPIVKERKPNTTRMIFVAGGYFQHSLDILEGYNVDDRTWTTLPKLTVPRSGLGAAFLKGTFYAVGGRNNAPGASYDSDWVDR
jgi:kelch-like protein 19